MLEDCLLFLTGDTMSLSDYIPEKFIELFSDPDFSKAIKGYCLYLIKEDKEYRDEVRTYFNECLLTSELKPVQRLAEVETVTGICDYFEEDHAPTLPEKITILSEKIEHLSESTCKPTTEPEIKPEGVADNRAVTLYNEAKKALETGTAFFGTKQVNHILRNLVPEGFRVKDGQNIGQAKKEAFARLDKLFPGMFSFKQKAYGRKDIRLVFQS